MSERPRTRFIRISWFRWGSSWMPRLWVSWKLLPTLSIWDRTLSRLIKNPHIRHINQNAHNWPTTNKFSKSTILKMKGRQILFVLSGHLVIMSILLLICLTPAWTLQDSTSPMETTSLSTRSYQPFVLPWQNDQIKSVLSLSTPRALRSVQDCFKIPKRSKSRLVRSLPLWLTPTLLEMRTKSAVATRTCHLLLKRVVPSLLPMAT